ncbi:MAG TPA: hypothetical protein VFO91_08635 [Anaerolineales bacterium]|nr:hypothetical protein [Anaerolineales bacterium]
MRKRRNKKCNPDENQNEWPEWFTPITHPVESEILAYVLKSNSRLGEVYFTVNMMQINYIVFKRNYEELVRLQDEFNKPLIFRELALQTDKGREITQDVILEFTRLLHNFLASAKMLVDVTRRWVRQQFDGTEFLITYQAEITKRFATNVQANFLEDLRNFALHRTLPLAIPELRLQQVEEHALKSSLGIVLIKNHLLEWKEWSELGRMQMDMVFDGEVDIQLVNKQYFDNVTAFTRWLFWQVRNFFNNEVNQINSAIQSVPKRS